jgi:hypothetical protein
MEFQAEAATDMASGGAQPSAVRAVRRPGDAFGIGPEPGGHGAGAKQGDNDRIRACSRTFRLSAVPALPAPHRIVRQEEAQHPER